MRRATATDDHRAEGRLRGLGAIAHPITLVSLVVLIVHDAFLRPVLPAPIAGKVSDVAGLVIFPLVLAALVALVTPDDDLPILVGAGTTVVWFGAMKLVVPVALATERLAEVVTPSARVTLDPTDLLALPMVLVAVHVWRHRVPPRAWAAPVLVLAVLWSSATSCSPSEQGTNVTVLADDTFIADVGHYEPLVVSADGEVQEDVEALARLQDDVTTLRVCDGTCIEADGHDVVEIAPDGTRTVVVDIPENRFDYAQRNRGGCDSGPFEGVQDIAVNSEGVVVVAHGHHGISVRDASGTWTRPDVGATVFAGGAPVELQTLVVALVVLALLLSTLAGDAAGAVVSSVGLVSVVVAILTTLPEASLLLLGGWAALAVAAVTAAAMLCVMGSRLGWAHALRVAGHHLVAGVIAWFVLWAWARDWIDGLWLAMTGVVLCVVGVAAVSIVRGRRRGTWPVLKPEPSTAAAEQPRSPSPPPTPPA